MSEITDRRQAGRRAPTRRVDPRSGDRQDAAPYVLVVGGDAVTRMMLRFLLADAGCAVAEVAQPHAFAAPARAADLLVVADGARDDGVETVAALHRAGCRGPVVLLTRGSSPAVRRRASMLGVLEIISLPAAPRDLQARLLVRLSDPRRQAQLHPINTGVLHAGGLTLRTEVREVSDGKGWIVKLTRLETNLLQALMCAAGRPLACRALLDHVWGDDYHGSDNALRIQVRRLREKLTKPSDRHSYIATVRSQGYVFNAQRAAPFGIAGAASDVPHVLIATEDQGNLTCTLDVFSERTKCS